MTVWRNQKHILQYDWICTLKLSNPHGRSRQTNVLAIVLLSCMYTHTSPLSSNVCLCFWEIDWAVSRESFSSLTWWLLSLDGINQIFKCAFYKHQPHALIAHCRVGFCCHGNHCMLYSHAQQRPSCFLRWWHCPVCPPHVTTESPCVHLTHYW